MRHKYLLHQAVSLCALIVVIVSCQSQNAGGFGSETSSGATVTLIDPSMPENSKITCALYPRDAFPVEGHTVTPLYSNRITVNEPTLFDSLTTGEYSLYAMTDDSSVGVFLQNIIIEDSTITDVEDSLYPTGTIEIVITDSLRLSELSLYVPGSPIQTLMADATKKDDSTVHLFLRDIPATSYNGLILSDHRATLKGANVTNRFDVTSGDTTSVQVIDELWVENDPTATLTLIAPTLPSGSIISCALYPQGAYPIHGYTVTPSHSADIEVNVPTLFFDSLKAGVYSLYTSSSGNSVGSFLQNITVEDTTITTIEDTLTATGTIEIELSKSLRLTELSLYIAGTPLQAILLNAAVKDDSTLHVFLYDVPAATYKSMQISDHRGNLAGSAVTDIFTVTSSQTTTIRVIDSLWVTEGNTDGMATVDWFYLPSELTAETVVIGLYSKYYNAISANGGTRIDSIIGLQQYSFPALPYTEYNIFAIGQTSGKTGFIPVTITDGVNVPKSDTLYTPSEFSVRFSADIDTTLTCYLEGSPFKMAISDAVRQPDQSLLLTFTGAAPGFSSRLMIGSTIHPSVVTPCSDSFTVQESLVVEATPFQL